MATYLAVLIITCALPTSGYLQIQTKAAIVIGALSASGYRVDVDKSGIVAYVNSSEAEARNLGATWIDVGPSRRAMESEANGSEGLHVFDKGAIARRPFWSSWFEEAQRLCCCKVSGENKLTASACTWKQPHTFDTGSGCNRVGLFNMWADQRRVSGTIDSSGTIAPFDTSLYKTQERNYQKICSALQGDLRGVTYETGNGKTKHHWFLPKIEKAQILELAKRKPYMPFAVQLAVAEKHVATDPVIKVGKTSSPAVGEEARALQNLEVKPVPVDKAKQIKMTQEAIIPSTIITTKMIKIAAAANSGHLCLSLCQPWPAPLGRLTPEKGCQVLDKYRCDKRKKQKCGDELKDKFSKSVVKNYCKNQCAGLYNGIEFKFGDCTTGP